jgi:dTDP-4-dehydrorhamnose 3,5-epimerase
VQFVATKLAGCVVVEAAPIRDARGAFARMFDTALFAARGLNPALAQASLSINTEAGTLRGLHYQAHPRMEDKLVGCVQGAIFDVAVDIRPGSPTFGDWLGTELSAGNLRQLYVPAGFAHGFQSLVPDTVVSYHISVPFESGLSAGLRYDDPAIGVQWPLPPHQLSERDQALPMLAMLDPAGLMPWTPSPSR